jgi:ADP-ribose pyrophosphatase
MERPPSPRLTRNDVEVVEKTTPFRGYFRIDRYALRHKLYEGGVSGLVTREIFERGHAVAVLLYDPGLDRVVFIEQFRAGAYAALASPWFGPDFSPWLVEMVAGIIDAGETPQDVARREAREEAGCEILDLVPLYHYLVSPGGTSESVFVFCGRVDASGIGGIHGIDAEHEDIRVFTVPSEEAFAWLDAGRIANSLTLIALLWLRLNRADLRRRWAEEG